MRDSSRLLRTGDALRRAFSPAEPVPADEPEEPAPDPVEEAHARGLAEGRAQGRAEASAEFDSRLAVLQEQVATTLRDLADVEPELIRRHGERTIELALEAASKIVRERIDAGDPVAARALAEAEQLLPAGEPLQARLHPDDVESVREALADEIERGRIELHADDKISRGGCIVDGPSGTVDASLETAVEVVGAAAEGRPETR